MVTRWGYKMRAAWHELFGHRDSYLTYVWNGGNEEIRHWCSCGRLLYSKAINSTEGLFHKDVGAILKYMPIAGGDAAGTE